MIQEFMEKGEHLKNNFFLNKQFDFLNITFFFRRLEKKSLFLLLQLIIYIEKDGVFLVFSQ